jgi:ribosomal protein S12 methylthiotransferase
MQRRVTRQSTEELLDKLRTSIPGLTMRTTFITGFPGETAEQFDELAEFIAAQRFERAGVFTYSFEPDTPAARLPDHLDEELKSSRRDRLMAIQQQVAFEYNDSQVGRQIDVLIDRRVEGEKNAWIGRTHADAPDVDSVVFVSGKKLKPGQFVRTEIVAVSDYDLVGVAVGKPR